ncbi:MAG: 6-phosphofructokinase [Zetaproteobacteria bacterium CG12_big_fil_rev_8_21_14_0_65_54_13]|nr:MAG: 6-phosphofructokinase [Zetaproteobacteria bacterium CG23_combo_of_CG06-09_8_20_14_all_54_7]PIW47889.1 MAG: 6-phosphofructokinase [Zetaproteobacteria bacterium CG12_big_fil_rev_8_21_14_0_65_54_13]PIX53849.1 MAG: 6-phosphofructokinase [Zetaproteobacteria bacterium CG_4_10_14_3_um_filter_54_28]PJA30809.1 MAG: 6-phosphofructokinase [Zetaproteobacteria bacterium CG_4_9_14_3_um_filter_54_145]
MALKGKMVIGQSGGPTAVINQSLVGAVLEARKHDAITGILGAHHGIAGIMKEDFIDLTTQSVEELECVANTPAAGLGSVRLKPGKAECERVFEVFKKNDVRFFFYIGGNDSAETAHIIAEMAKEANYDFCTVHIPKTIDNDLRVTDHCPGFASAARFVALAFMGDDRDNAALQGIKINIVMGRDAGFLTAASALARQAEGDGPHLIYVPERAFDIGRFQTDVKSIVAKYGRCVVAVSEGITDADGHPVMTSGERDSHGNLQLSGTGALGDFLSGKVKEAYAGESVRVRADTFGYLQRSFPTVVSDVDVSEARMVGTFGVSQAVAAGEPGSVAIRRLSSVPYASECFMTPLSTVAREATSLKDEYINATGNDVTQAWLDYVGPLVGDMPKIGRLF